MYSRMNIQLSLFSTSLWNYRKSVDNFMLTVFCVRSTDIMYMYISSECRDLRKVCYKRYFELSNFVLMRFNCMYVCSTV